MIKNVGRWDVFKPYCTLLLLYEEGKKHYEGNGGCSIYADNNIVYQKALTRIIHTRFLTTQ